MGYFAEIVEFIELHKRLVMASIGMVILVCSLRHFAKIHSFFVKNDAEEKHKKKRFGTLFFSHKKELIKSLSLERAGLHVDPPTKSGRVLSDEEYNVSLSYVLCDMNMGKMIKFRALWDEFIIVRNKADASSSEKIKVLNAVIDALFEE
ncbi:TPA: hypothetical protein ON497_001049 [Morganella morganii]|nr:hypothetical protein [Morganella morganii]